MENLTVLSLPKEQNRKFLFKCSRWSIRTDYRPSGCTGLGGQPQY
ncbi:hypothetical protein Ec53638_A0283 (plasmid) [Escherichia coli 53638]|nr:hypothetical protein Ec53638_A0283 [Escherichia coli 53638]